jgi:hypothetical protein
MRKRSSALLALGCWWLTGVNAQQAEPEAPSPDLDFLEYLGAWAEEDDEWLAIEEWEKDEAAEADSDAQGSEQEKKDEDDEGE